MRFNTFILFALTIIFFACESENNSDPGGPTSKYLQIVPTIANRIETKAGVVNTFKENDQIGLFVSGTNNHYSNIPAEFNGSEWNLKDIEDAKSIQAYFPYSPEYETVESVPVNIQDQTDYLYAPETSISGNIARLNMKHALSLVSIIVMKNDYNYEGKVTQLEIEGIPTTGEVNLKSGGTKITGEAVTYKRNLNYTLNDYSPEKISTIVLPVAVADLKEVTFRVLIDEVGYSFSVPQSHVWEAGKEYTYTLNVYETFKPDVLEVIPVDVAYWNTYGKTDKITILDKPNQNLWYDSGSTYSGRMTIKGETQIFGGAIRNNSSTAWEGEWRFGMFDMAGNLVELYQPYHITIPAKDIDGDYIPCFVDCAPGKYQALPLLKDKGTDYWYVPRLQFEGVYEYTVLPKSANVTPSIKSVKLEGWYEAYPGIVDYKLNKPFNTVITITNRAETPLKGEIKAMWERNLTHDFNAYPISFMEVSGWDTKQWADEIGRISIDYSSDVKIKQEQMTCTITKERPKSNICVPAIHWYYRAEGTSEWILMRCDFDHQLDKLKGITKFKEGKPGNLTEDCLLSITSIKRNPAVNYAYVIIKE